MRLELGTVINLIKDIQKVNRVAQLRDIRDHFQQSFQLDEQFYYVDSIERWNTHINELHDEIIFKAIELAELRMVGEGLGPPPASYCYLLLGSAGRSEQTLASDQDSGIVYESTGHQEDVKHYFKTLASYIVTSLMDLGYPPCDGKVQSDEDLWCQTVDEWKMKLAGWFEEASWESIRYLLIVADARVIAGEKALYQSIQSLYKEKLSVSPYVLERMIENTVQHKMITGFFGQFITDRYGQHVGSIDVKYGAYIPFVNSVRWLALYSGIDKCSTLQRLEGLAASGVLTSQQYLAYRDAFLQMLQLRLLAGYQLQRGMYMSESKLHPKQLAPIDIKRLKKNVRLGKELQKIVLKRFARLK